MKDIIFYVGYEDELSLVLIRKIFSQLKNKYLIGARFPDLDSFHSRRLNILKISPQKIDFL